MYICFSSSVEFFRFSLIMWSNLFPLASLSENIGFNTMLKVYSSSSFDKMFWKLSPKFFSSFWIAGEDFKIDDWLNLLTSIFLSYPVRFCSTFNKAAVSPNFYFPSESLTITAFSARVFYSSFFLTISWIALEISVIS